MLLANAAHLRQPVRIGECNQEAFGQGFRGDVIEQETGLAVLSEFRECIAI